MRLPSSVRSSEISLAELLSALSFALDLTEDAIPGHALRSCLLGMRLGKRIGLPASRSNSLYYALLLKDIGCSSNAARLCEIIGGGDEREVKSGVKLEDWTKPHQPRLSTLQLLWRTVHPGSGTLRRTAGILLIGLTQHRNNAEMITLRCDRGASIVRKLGLGDLAAEAVRGLDEHWDGSGYPERRKRFAIPVESRILAVAQHLDVFASKQGRRKALDVLEERSGRWFEPELVRIARSMNDEGTLWRSAMCDTPESETHRAVLELAPDGIESLKARDIDLICEAFADVVDAKSTFTFRHSLGVTETAARMARGLGLDKERVRMVHRAALLHDLGKLRVPNSILDKSGPLDAMEWQAIREHPRLTREILSRIGPFAGIAWVAGAHHERLDGSGYPDRLTAKDLNTESRIIAVADVFSALTEDRPYRKGLAPDKALEIVSREAPHRLDADCVDALKILVANS
jgi:putative nucleotidyltransferase with HDIG domain